MPSKKFCITKNGMEIAKLIPFGSATNPEFKLALSMDMEIRCMFFNRPYDTIPIKLKREYVDNNPVEFSYHMRKGDSPTKIHMKTKDPTQVNPILPITNLMDPDKRNIFPIPFCKIGVVPDGPSKMYKAKSGKQELDLGMDNVVEIYLVQAGFRKIFKDFQREWELFFHLYHMVPIEYFATGRMVNYNPKLLAFKAHKPISIMVTDLSDSVSQFVCHYFDESIDGERHPSHISFIENGEYLTVLSSIPVQMRDASGEVKTKPAYCWQVPMTAQYFSHDETLTSIKLFGEIAYKMGDLGMKLHGIILND